MTTLKVGTLFSGIGAPEMALKNISIPYKIIYACDNDKYAKETYLLNHNPLFFYDDINDMIDKNHKIDLLIFGFPCQSYSIAGKKLGISDERGKLIYSAIKIINKQKPKYFIAENVTGILNNKITFDTIINLMKQCGYNVSYEILDSINFGVAQQRKRIWFIGIRKDINKKISPIKLIHKKVLLSSILDKKVDKRYYATKLFLQKEKVKQKFKNSLGKTMPCITHTIARNGSSSEYISYVAAIYKAIGVTRKPTPKECLRLFGFSHTFKFPKNMSITHKYNQLGNTMVVSVIEAIINAVIL